ncbi:tRNA (guanosine(37)-N1)-methyltransferase TrmD [Candidatus Giovannonibacteria bacterium]|nr:tRNA (guanosine(37)-N1)-methyltransferase TrmD [Candidatus Giovannonibacteria bacterium]
MSIMRFDIITIFPNVFEGYLNESMFKRAKAKKLLDIRVHDLRDFAPQGKKSLPAKMRSFRRVDDRPFGGGPGMVLQAEPLIKAVNKIAVKKLKPLVLITVAAGKQFDSKLAAKFSNEKQIIIIAGHYEGIDERIKKLVRDSGLRIIGISSGPYVLTGGELPAMIIVDAVSRHIPGFLGKAESLEETRHGVGIPAYTRPEVLKYKGKTYKVPPILLTGHHMNIENWRRGRLKK